MLRKTLVIAITSLSVLAFGLPAQAAELLTVELTAQVNKVTVTQGQTAQFTVTVNATGNYTCGASSTAAIPSAYSINSAGQLAYSIPVKVEFAAASPQKNGSCDIATTTHTISASISAAAGTPVGVYELVLSEAQGVVAITNSNATGTRLNDATPTRISFEVERATNRPPTVGTPAPDATGSEGAAASTGGSFTDLDLDTLTIAKVSGAGSVVDEGDGAWSWSHTPSDDGSGTVVVQATDGDGGLVTDSFDWVASNVAPVRTVSASDATGVEGETVSSSGAFTDVAGDVPLSISKVDGPGSLTVNADGSWSWSLATSDEVSASVTVQADDGDGGTKTDTFQVSVLNVAPGVTTDAGDVTGNEGSALSNAGAFSDLDELAISQKSGAGSVTDNGNRSWSWSHPGLDDASGTVVVEADDGDGGTQTDSFDFQVRNVAPVVLTAANDANGVEGTELSAAGAFHDVTADTLTVTKLSGEGTVTDNGDGAWSWSLTSADDGSGSVTVQASDDDGGTQTDTFTWAAANANPTVTSHAQPATGSEGNTLATSGAFNDVPADDLTITAETGSPGTLVDNGDGTWSWTLPTNDNVNGTIIVTATDDDGGSVTDTFTYSASNIAPTISTLATTGTTGTGCMSGNAVTVSFTVADPSSADSISGVINWGDGVTEAYTGRSVSRSHTYIAGDFTISVSASDDDGSAASPAIIQVRRSYAVSAILPPINADGSSVVKAGSTVPVKVRITDCLQMPVSHLAPTIRLTLVSGSTPTSMINEAPDSTSAADTTGYLRWDPINGHYIYNMATKSLPDPNARYKVTVALGSVVTEVGFGLRSK